MSAYKQEFGAPVAVPFVCSKCSTANTEELFLVKQISSPSIMDSVDGDSLVRVSSFVLTAAIPVSLLTLGKYYIKRVKILK